MGNRPFRRKGIVELEELFQDSNNDVEVLEAIAHELAYRTVPRAHALAERVGNRLQELGRQRAVEPAPSQPATPRATQPNSPLREEAQDAEPNADVGAEEPELDVVEPVAAAQESDFNGAEQDGAEDVDETDGFEDRPVTGTLPPDPPEQRVTPDDDPAAILDLWTALEVLSPQTYVQPRDLADGDARRIAQFGAGRKLPWVDGPERSRPSYKLYYQIILGAVPMEVASTTLLKAFGDKRPERTAARGYAALAAVTVDRHGRPVEEDPVAVSSFGWGYGQARAGQLAALKTWPQIQRQLIEGIERRLNRVKDDEILPLDEPTIAAVYRWLCAQIGLPETERVAPYFAIRLYRWFQAPGDPEPMLLNSFFLDDLAYGRELQARGALGAGLARYLGLAPPAAPIDLLEDKRSVESAVAPARTPAARWPTAGGHSLALLQQTAVNIVFDKLGSSAGILGINGPPGTGKTTLLRDLVAGVVLERARALAEYADPEVAFKHRGRIFRGSFIHLYELDAPIRGHEILVASSNNKAVENISRELPGRSEIEASLAPHYFPTIAANVAGEDRDAWGMIAGVLGNAANRVAFRRDFWMDRDNGLRAYLWAAAGNPATFERENPETGATETVIANVVQQEKPPRDKNAALNRWQQARREFRRALKNAEDGLKDLERVRGLALAQAAAAERRGSASRQIDETILLQVAAQRAAARAAVEHDAAAQAMQQTIDGARKHRSVRPGILSRLFRRKLWSEWSAVMTARDKIQIEARRAATTAERSRIEAEGESRTLAVRLNSAREELTRVDALIADNEQKLAIERARLPGQLAEATFWNASHADLQRSTPWLNAQTQRLRGLCFARSVELHRAFIDVAAKPIRNNLNALFGILMGDGLDDGVRAVLPSLWSTLFLAVPVISTTFASVGRMLGPMPPESLGWLLIDEAGQALPQAAVGAVMRARRSVVVGDPLQIEPVVTLPLSLVDRIARRMSVNPMIWTAPKASAQTLADAASPYQSWLEQVDGSVRVGIPLLVHRRCAEPMFGISNAIAYANKMVQAKRPKPSHLRDALGPARWLHVTGSGLGKWCRAEGEAIIDVLQQLVEKGVEQPDVFVITPFRIVAQQMRQLLEASDVVRHFAPQPRDWARDRIGTVHTFQGREAEAVFLVLGAPEVTQTGARNWAGYPPNLANVAVSRAKEVIYVVGNRELWRSHGSFRTVSERLPR